MSTGIGSFSSRSANGSIVVQKEFEDRGERLADVARLRLHVRVEERATDDARA